MAELEKTNRLSIALLIFPLHMAILPVKSPCTLTIISLGVPLVIIVVVGHGVCCKIFAIWNNRLLSNPFWKLVCVILGWFPTRAISLWPVVFLDMAIFATGDKSYLTWQTTLLHIPYHSHFGGSWSQLVSKNSWSTAQFTQCMTLEVKIGFENFLCL